MFYSTVILYFLILNHANLLACVCVCVYTANDLTKLQWRGKVNNAVAHRMKREVASYACDGYDLRDTNEQPPFAVA